jgi:membrane protease YdiL (CAAX protease family)
MEQTMPRSAAATAARPSTGTRAAIERHGLLVYTLIAYGITWMTMIAVVLAMSAGAIDEDGAIVGIASNVAPAGPLFAALLVIAATKGRSGLADLGRSIVRWRVNPLWYAYVFLGVPGLVVGSFALLHGAPLLGTLADQWQYVVSQVSLGILSIALFTGVSEEPGWRGYAQPWANRRYAPLAAAFIVSVIWAAWHLPNGLFGGSMQESLLHMVPTVIHGILLAWIWNSTRSLLLVMLTHGANNAMAGLFTHALAGTPAGISIIEYYAVSSIVFGAIVAIVIVRTKGRLGLGEPGRPTAA